MTRIFVTAACALAPALVLGVNLSTSRSMAMIQSPLASGPSTVTGRVATSTDLPLSRAVVMLRRHVAARAVVTSEDIFREVADRDGRFSFTTVPEGIYTLSATHAGYLPAQFGQQTPTGPGRPLPVPAGQTVRADLTAFPDAAITGRTDTTVSLSGTVTTSSGAPVQRPAISVRPVNAASANGASTANVRMLTNGRFIVDDLPPDEYMITAEGMIMRPHGTGQAAEFEYARLRLTVAESADDLSIRLRPAARVHVSIQSPIPLPGQVMVLLQADDGMGTSHMTTISDGRTSMPAHPGRYRIRVKGLPTAWVVDRVDVLGRDVMRNALVVEGGEDVNATVVLSPNSASLTGSVLLSSPQARPNYTVVLLSARADDRTPAAEGVRVKRPDRRGVFAIQGLRPGVYYLAAVERLDATQMYDPAFWKTIEAEGTRFSLGAGERRTIALRYPASTRRAPNEQD